MLGALGVKVDKQVLREREPEEELEPELDSNELVEGQVYSRWFLTSDALGGPNKALPGLDHGKPALALSDEDRVD